MKVSRVEIGGNRYGMIRSSVLSGSWAILAVFLAVANPCFCLSENFLVSFGMVPYNEGAINNDCWGSKCSASSQNDGGYFIIGNILAKIKSQQFLALCDDQFLRFFDQVKCFAALEFYLVCQYKIRLACIGVGQELLGAFARRSAFSVVVPFYLFRHDFLLRYGTSYHTLVMIQIYRIIWH